MAVNAKAPTADAPSVTAPTCAPTSVPTAPVSIRITPSGKLYTYVRHALDSLTDHPDQQVEIHTRLSVNTTLPPIKVVSTSATSTFTSNTTVTHSGLLPCTTTIPRLITVLEIIKREYLRLHAGKGKGLWQYNKLGNYSGKEVEAWEEQQRGRRVSSLPIRAKGKGKGREGRAKEAGREEAASQATGGGKGADQMDVDTATGADGDLNPVGEQVHPVAPEANHSPPPPPPPLPAVTTAEDAPMATDGPTTTGTNHADSILSDILNGGPNHIKMRHTPYMVVVLSTRPLPHLLGDPDISYQPVKPLGRRKARRARRKTLATEDGADGAHTDGDEHEEDGAEPMAKKARLSVPAAVRGVRLLQEEEREELEEVEVVEGSSDGYDDEEEGETMEVEEE
ncbi:hypothetical protein QFC21_006175 [Naganishia friedmannii]|uniref:Uncharacterized protein n=1 Tax=Naganishia friedmannii TaxID=89922 RepID=A0ACC2V401_9TREE|nr:hypothetical protein QFC21_006175 [Naganishia friedmannii]